MEEFQHLLDSSLIASMKESMYNATVGDGYRVGGVDGDNRESDSSLLKHLILHSYNVQCFPSIVILGALHLVRVYGILTSSASKGTCE